MPYHGCFLPDLSAKASDSAVYCGASVGYLVVVEVLLEKRCAGGLRWSTLPVLMCRSFKEYGHAFDCSEARLSRLDVASGDR